MDLLAALALGFSTALSPENLLYCFAGVLVGTMVGVLPGLGPVPTIAMLLPLTFGLPPVAGLIMLAGIYYGAQYGGSTTAILINVPGESSSVVTAIDGYRMAQAGRAGTALATAAIGSFVAGCIATLVIALFAPQLSQLAIEFGPADYFSLMVLGLVASVVLAHGSLLKALGMMVLGLLLGLVGTDVTSGTARFTLGQQELVDGVNFVVIAMGLFGLAEIVRNLESGERRDIVAQHIGSLWPSRDEWSAMAMPILRGTGLGSLLGILPGGGAMLSAFAAYSLEKKLSPRPETFGRGALEGVAGPESANNAGAQTSFIPMLTLGVPSNPVMALMIGAMVLKGIQPGPTIMTEQATLFWGVIASMWIGNVMLVILNLPLIGLWVRLLTVPYRLLYPAVLLFCAVGVVSLSNATFDVGLAALFAIVGYIFLKLDCEPAPLLLGFIIGPMLEEHLRRAMILSRGDPSIFITQPISATLLVLTVLALVAVIAPTIRARRSEVFE